jgi:cobalt-zinc-cadmium efflux system protein
VEERGIAPGPRETAGGPAGGATRQRALAIALGLNGAFLVVEVVGGAAFGSLALLADAAHMGSDVGALTIASVAARLAARPPSDRHSYGLQRAEILAAALNAVVLVAAAAWIAVAAIGRIGETVDVEGAGVTIVAAGGLAVNVGSALVLARAAGRSLNLRAAQWHMASDALGSVAALATGLAVLLWDATWVDVAASLLVAALVVLGAWRLLRDATRVLLEATPAHVDPDAVRAALLEDRSVRTVHHLHVWSLGSESEALSGHVVVDDVPTLHDAEAVARRLKAMLAERFAIEHSTLEIECHPCE